MHRARQHLETAHRALICPPDLVSLNYCLHFSSTFPDNQRTGRATQSRDDTKFGLHANLLDDLQLQLGQLPPLHYSQLGLQKRHAVMQVLRVLLPLSDRTGRRGTWAGLTHGASRRAGTGCALGFLVSKRGVLPLLTASGRLYGRRGSCLLSSRRRARRSDGGCARHEVPVARVGRSLHDIFRLDGEPALQEQ